MKIDRVIDGRIGEQDKGTPIPLVEFRQPVSNLMVEADDKGNPRLIRLFFGLQVLELERDPNVANYAPPSEPGKTPPLGFLVKTAELPAGFPTPPDPDPADTIAIALANNLKGERFVSAVVYPHCLVIDFKVSVLMVFPDRFALVTARAKPAAGETAPAC